MGPLGRRHFIGLGASASVAFLAGCSEGSDRRSGLTVPSNSPEPSSRPPDVVASYRAGPVDLDLAGTIASTWGYSDTVPGKLLRARAGDLVEITIDNELPEATSFTYRFVVPDPGTYWFHPHHGLQLDRGLYAPFIVDDPADDVDADAEYVVVLDDWLDGLGTTPDQELLRIREMGAQMGEMGGMSDGGMSMATSPLLGGDAGDAVYPHHLINGRPPTDPLTFEPRPRPGDRVRLRVINAGSDTAYRFAVGGHRMTVTHADGFPVVPVEVDAFVIGMGERYDVTINIQSGAWPVIALAEGKNMRAAAVLRTTDAQNQATPDLTAEIAELDASWLRYADLSARDRVAFELPDDIPVRSMRLTGCMAGFDWGIDGHPYGEHEPIPVSQGEWISLVIENTTTMWHPIHLHGHTPQLGGLSGGVRKDTVNILPGDTMQMTLHADNPGKWMLHCHNAYHLEVGMATVLSYAT